MESKGVIKMEEPGKIYEELGVKIGDCIEFEVDTRTYKGIVASPKDADKKGNVIDGDKYLYYRSDINDEVVGYKNIKNLKILKKHSEVENKAINNCPVCKIPGEYINGAYKCPNCWKVWL